MRGCKELRLLNMSYSHVYNLEQEQANKRSLALRLKNYQEKTMQSKTFKASLNLIFLLPCRLLLDPSMSMRACSTMRDSD